MHSCVAQRQCSELTWNKKLEKKTKKIKIHDFDKQQRQRKKLNCIKNDIDTLSLNNASDVQ